MKAIKMKIPDWSYTTKEELNTLRTNIQFAGTEKRVIVITSCLESEGKSSISFNLSISFAQQGNRVLYIDTDLRRSAFLSLKEGKVDFGLSHYLSGQSDLNSIIYITDIPRLDTIPSGPIPPNPTELLSRSFKETIQLLKEQYDYIIVDTAPLGLVIDAAIIAKACDASILVIKAGNIRYKFLQEVKSKLIATECPFLGVVLNQVNYNKDGYYKSYYGKKYADKYEKGEQKKILSK